MDAPESRDLTLVVEVLRRLVALALFMAAATLGFGYGQTLVAIAAVAAAILVYWLVPRPAVPQGAVHHERMPTVTMPDLLGFMLATTFFALPLIVAAHDPWIGGPWALYLLTGLPGLIAMIIFWIAIRHQCLWLKVTGHDLTIADMRRIEILAFDRIAEVVAETKPPPRWLSPLLILFGGWRGLGIALLTGQRPSHSLVIRLKDGTSRRVPADAFPDQRQIVAALAHGGVALDSMLGAVAGRHGRRKGRARRPEKGESDKQSRA
ncbi:MAG: hypothetical protein KKH72_12695 [Alphaproteobacteria bacterium]|nr:hypothetical protein [Alphaproteobacteria bacterium]